MSDALFMARRAEVRLAANFCLSRFDDGPNPIGHQRLLDALAETDTRRTFFLIDEQ